MPFSDDELTEIAFREQRERDRQYQEWMDQQEADRQARAAEEQARRAAEQPHSGPTW
ncbi:hypothetical protein [Streptomyces sp. NBC_01506]|uniref:hypothetical protein n=1 Tax=Streptomyces sp. NBC_01506 TaxID=2903887 RepID=UPI0038699897